MRANQILELLAVKHSKDLFVPECKDGPTQWGSHLRLDAWAMMRSWANPRSVGYEIKVSRSDFLQDSKLESYMQYCHQFYIVAPSGIVSKEELPEGAGLMVPSKNATKLFTKVKATYRDIEWPLDLLRYILLARVHFVGYDNEGRFSARERTIEYWREWLKTKEINHAFGYRVSRTIRQEIDKQITAVERENSRFKAENEGLAQIKRMAGELGISIHNDWQMERDMKRIAAEQKTGYTEKFEVEVRSALSSLQAIANRIAEAK